jgi:hypothetical protein
MTEFIRVRSAHGAQTQFDAPAAWVALHPDDYVRIRPKRAPKPPKITPTSDEADEK